MSLRRPTHEELLDLGVLAARSGILDAPEAILAFEEAGPWRIAVTPQGDGVLLERWRAHMDWLAMRGAWAAPRRLPALLHDVRGVAREHGYGTILSPFLAEELAGPWERAGMRPTLRIAMLRRELGSADLDAPGAPPAGMVLAEGGPEDLDALLTLDGRCFEPVWAYDRELLESYISRDRVVTARDMATDEITAYVMVGRTGDEGLVGRLAVVPERRGRGLGSALLREAHRGLAFAGVPYVTLTTQADNAAAQRIYARAGYRTLRGALVGLTVPV